MNKPYHPDDTDLTWRRRKNDKDKGGNHGGKGGGPLAPFMPGDRMALARQLSFGFGGKPKHNADYLSQTYTRFPQPDLRFGIGGGRGGNNRPGGIGLPNGYTVIGPDGQPTQYRPMTMMR